MLCITPTKDGMASDQHKGINSSIIRYYYMVIMKNVYHLYKGWNCQFVIIMKEYRAISLFLHIMLNQILLFVQYHADFQSLF